MPMRVGDGTRKNGAVSDQFAPLDASAAHLAARLSVLEVRVHLALDARAVRLSGSDDEPLPGWFLRTRDVVELMSAPVSPGVELPPETAHFLARAEAAVDAAEAAGAPTALRRMQRAFGLDDVDVELLLLAAAADLDERFERCYACLQDDPNARRVSVGLALQLAGQSALAGADRARLDAGSALIDIGLVLVGESHRPFLSRTLQVPDRVVGHLVGSDVPDPLVAPLLAVPVLAGLGDPTVLARAIGTGTRLCYVQESRGTAGAAIAVAALESLGVSPLQLDLRRLPIGALEPAMVQAVAREALLRGGALVAGPLEQLADRGVDAVRAFAELPCYTVLVGARTWDPHWSKDVPLVVPAPMTSRAERAALWRSMLDGAGPAGVVSEEVVADFRLTPPQVLGAVTAAAQTARAHDRPLDAADLRIGARSQNASGLERLAQRIEPSVGWQDLVLPAAVLRSLQEFVSRCRHRDTVFGDWRMGGIASRRRGTIGLFSGPPGTGKTMAADVIAGEFGLDLYVINLATVVDKYIGETEKNLERIFTEAEQTNGLLFFDEADALFGKRSEVKDARDRYANIEVAYLLQRMELFDGVALLATNFKTNLDEAFMRRLDASIDFPTPDVASRRRLWEISIGELVPRGPGIDLDFLAHSFEFSGGNIRNIAVTGAFLAAERGEALQMSDLITATYREYRKLGRLCNPAEFGPYALVAESA
jgi:hypothetical protein